MCASVFYARVCVVDKWFAYNRFDNVYECVVYDPVKIRSRAYNTFLRVVDMEISIDARYVGFITQGVYYIQNIVL